MFLSNSWHIHEDQCQPFCFLRQMNKNKYFFFFLHGTQQHLSYAENEVLKQGTIYLCTGTWTVMCGTKVFYDAHCCSCGKRDKMKPNPQENTCIPVFYTQHVSQEWEDRCRDMAEIWVYMYVCTMYEWSLFQHEFLRREMPLSKPHAARLSCPGHFFLSTRVGL